MGRAYEVRKASIEKNGMAKTKIYTNYAKEIYSVCKKGGTDPEGNLLLKRLISDAKKDSVPNDVINRAIEKAKGGAGEDYEVVTYEGFGPGESTLIVKTMTDNVNRTVGMVRAAFNKVHKSLGVTNSVSYNYDYMAILSFKGHDELEVLDLLTANSIEPIDMEEEDDILTIFLEPKDRYKAKDLFEKEYPSISYEIDEEGMYAKEKVTLSPEDKEQFLLLLKLLNDIDDVSTIYHNVNLD